MTGLARFGRAAARHAVLNVLAVAQRSRAPSALDRPRVAFLYLHGVPEPKLGNLAALVEGLRRRHTVIGHDEAVRRVVAGAIDRPYASFSFDDGFASNRAAATLLARLHVSACYFVPTGFVGCSTVGEARRFFRTQHGVDEGAMNWGDLERLRAQGHEIGNHTVSHPDLGQVCAAQVQDEVEGAAEELRRRLGDCLHFAWPFGRFQHFTPVARDAVRNSGHVSCSSALRGAHIQGVNSRADDLCIRREHVVAGWPWRQVRYFLASSSNRSAASSNSWPSDWPWPPHLGDER